MAHGKTRLPIRRSLVIALLFQIAWVLAGLLFALSGVQVGWGLLIANLLTLWAPAAFMFITRIKLSDGFQYGYAAFITGASLIGSSLGGYGAIPHWDTIVHVYSGTLLAWFGFIVATSAEPSIKRPLPLWLKNVFAFMTPLAFAAGWEIYEFTSDRLWGTSMQAGGLEDTIVDMLAALLGAIVALIASTLWIYRPTRRFWKK